MGWSIKYTTAGKTKNYKIGICCFSAKQAALRLGGSESGKYVRVGRHVYPQPLFQWANTIKTQLSALVKYKADLIIPLKMNLFSSWYSYEIAKLALNNNHSPTQIHDSDIIVFSWGNRSPIVFSHRQHYRKTVHEGEDNNMFSI